MTAATHAFSHIRASARRAAQRRSLNCRSLALLALLSFALPEARAAEPLVPYRVENGAIAAPLAGPGDAARGREIVLGRDANCILCHTIPDSGARVMGDLGPPLAGTATRHAAGQLRLRVVDSSRLNPDTIMPSYYRTEGLNRPAPQYRDKPILSAQQIEDVVAWLLTLR